MKRRTLAGLICLCLLVGLLSTAAWATDTPSVYVALGDSITTGYKPGADSSAPAGTVDAPFAQQIASNKGYELRNEGQNGETSTTLLAKLQGKSLDVSDADLITITLGGNDLMEALYQYLSARYSESGAVSITPEEMKAMLMGGDVDLMTLSKLMGYLPDFAASQQAQGALVTFSKNLAAIFQLIKAQNADATVVITTQYNPYSHLTSESAAGMVNAFGAGVQALNTAISSVAGLSGVTVADVYTAFETVGGTLCNAYFTIQGFNVDFNLDFHPNQAGHDVIAQTIGAVLMPVAAQMPTISTQPQSASYMVGDEKVAALTVEASVTDGGTLSYQWYCATAPSPDAVVEIPGATDNQYTPDVSTEGTTYYLCVVTNTKDGAVATAMSEIAAIMVRSHVHSMTHHDAVEATCVNAGSIEYWTCEICGKHFKDPNGVQEIALSDTVLPATGHGETQVKNAKEASCTQEGYTGDKICTVCGDVVEKGTVIPKLSHTYQDGVCTVCGSADLEFQPTVALESGNTWTKGSKDGLSFTSNAAFADFQKVQVDGKDLESSMYEVKEGSTMVTLKASYLETLSAGTHTLSIVSRTGTATAEFVIQNSAANNGVQSPQTGDDSHLVLWCAMAGISVVLLGTTFWFYGKRSFGKDQ